MTTYNTYQEAKIANPEFEVAVVTRTDEHTPEMGKFISVLKNDLSRGGYSFADKKKTGYPNTTDGYYTVCYPADHCITLGELRANHGGERAGDLILGYSSGSVKVIKNIDVETRSFDHECLVLRAAALENQMNIDNLATQTPEEKEVLDLIDTTPHQYEMSKFSNPKEVEWSDSDELPPLGCEVMTSYTDNGCDDWCDFHGPSVIIAYHGDYVWVAHHGKFNRVHELCSIEFEKVEKETPQQREERERLEAAYDLYEEGCKAEGGEYDSFDSWSENKYAVVHFLAIVDKTNYRKESN